MIHEKCKSCVNSIVLKSKGKTRIECRQHQDTASSCDLHAAKNSNNNMRSAHINSAQTDALKRY